MVIISVLTLAERCVASGETVPSAVMNEVRSLLRYVIRTAKRQGNEEMANRARADLAVAKANEQIIRQYAEALVSTRDRWLDTDRSEASMTSRALDWVQTGEVKVYEEPPDDLLVLCESCWEARRYGVQ